MNFISYIIDNRHKVAILSLQHINLFMISIIIAIVIGMIISILITRPGKERMGTLIMSITGAAQAIPSIAIIALAFIFVGIGAFPSIIALVVYSLVPIVFNATSGFLSVPNDIIEAAKGTGFTDKQILFRIKMPISMPVIVAGIRSAATINIGTATVASFIGGGGLGDLIFMGLKLYRSDIIIAGSIIVALMAVIIDFILRMIEDLIIPKKIGVIKGNINVIG
ncbi:MAG: ABC transporter permease [Spirochaetota bacterium]|nr:ABC transporter permease [Spirochaetota bacterium]